MKTRRYRTLDVVMILVGSVIALSGGYLIAIAMGR